MVTIVGNYNDYYYNHCWLTIGMVMIAIVTIITILILLKVSGAILK